MARHEPEKPKAKAPEKEPAAPAPAERPPDPPAPTKPAKGLSPLEEIAQLRKRISEDEARVWELEHPIIEYPKMLKGG